MPDDMKRRAAHYRGLAAGAQRMRDMGHTTASGGSNKPPRKGCLPKKTIAVFLLGSAYGISQLAEHIFN